MTAILSNPELTEAAIAGPEAVAERILRTPFYLQSQERPLLGWLHRPKVLGTLDQGIVICSPVGYEHLHAYRGLRHLADRLAEQGFPVLRFDWDGMGDSFGTDLDPDRLATWKQNLRDVLRWIKEEGGCKRLSIIGLRIGGSIASLIAEEQEIDDLVLWSPIPKGKSFVRELHAIDMTGEARSAHATHDIEAGGFLLTESTAGELSKINLQELHPRCGRVLLVSNAESAGDTRLVEAWSKLGINVAHEIHGGLPQMLAEPHRSQVPHATLGTMVQWFAAQAEKAGRLTTTISEHPQAFQTKTFSERLVRFAEPVGLFGIVTEPSVPVSSERPTILLLNAGATTRIGPGRLNVHLARRLAEEGFRSFRIDFQGLGDSIQPDPTQENDSYAPTVFRDVQLAIDYLKSEHGVERCVLLGLCSGAYAAFQSAAQLADTAIAESLLINPLTYFWREGMTIDDDPGRHLIRQHYYRHAMRDPKKWLRFLTGRSGTSFATAARIVAKRIEMALLPRKSKSTPKQEEVCRGFPGHPVKQDLGGDLHRIIGHGRHLSMFFSDTDPGYMILKHYAGREAAKLEKRGEIEFRFFANSDHTFSREEPRRRLIASIKEHLQERYSG